MRGMRDRMGERHHYIPRFLQKGFASRIEEEKVWIWQSSANRPPVEISTKHAGVEKRFYGNDDELEFAFAEYEQKFAPAIIQVAGGRNPNELSQILSSLVWTQAVRTKAIRESFDNALRSMLGELLDEARSTNLAARISSRTENEFDSMFADIVQKLPHDERLVAEESYKVPKIRLLMIQAARSQLSNGGFTTMLSRLLTAVTDGEMISEMVRAGTLKGLKKMLDLNTTPNATIPKIWKVVKFEDHSIILGDICTFYVSADGRCGGAGRFGEDWMAVCLPISHNSILIGTNGQSEFELSAEVVNFYSASLSADVIFSSRASPTFLSLANKIGTLEPLIDQTEIAELVTQAWQQN